MELIQVNQNGKNYFRIIPKKDVLTLKDITNMFRENMVFVSIRDAMFFEANGYVYMDFPVSQSIGTDFIRLMSVITDAELAAKKE